MAFENTLFYGDCLNVLRDIPDETADLIYLDPPFNSQRDYNAFFSSKDGKQSEAQIMAFEDTWQWGDQAQSEYDKLLKNPDAGSLAETLLPSLRKFLKQTDMMAYLVMMSSRLLELKRVLKDPGSLYLHCDPTASHYLKLVLDSLFGASNFKNEIIWSYRTTLKVLKSHFGRDHDVILFYTKGKNPTFHPDRADFPGSEATKKRWAKYADADGFVSNVHFAGSKSTIIDTSDSSKGFNINYGIPRDVWDISAIVGGNKENLGYPTQKPLALLERIIKASSNPGDVILDPFCGCGTAVHAAQKLGRNWIGIDITHLAVGLIKRRMHSAFPEAKFKVSGTPQDVEAAKFLAESDGNEGRYQFQYWALSLIDASPSQDKKKGADGGSDGFIWAYNSPTAETPFKINISVKSGKIPANHIRELGGMLGKDDIEICLLITLQDPSKVMVSEAISYGDYEYPNGKKFKRIQILTIKELLEGKQPHFLDYLDGAAMPKKAKREVKKSSQATLFKGQSDD